MGGETQGFAAARKSPRGLWLRADDLTPPWGARRRPIVLHHGIGTCNDIWAAWIPLLAASHPVLRYDMRGFGASDALPDVGAADLLDVLIDDLLEVAGTGGPVHLVGESAGGTVVLAAALRHPGRVASVTLSNAAFAGRGIGQIDGWRKLFDEEGVSGWSSRMMEWRFAPGALVPEAASWFAQEQQRSTSAAALAVAYMLAGIDLTGQLADLRIPLLILAPDQSPFVSLDMATALQNHVRDSELRVFQGVRHGLPFSHPEECANALLDFLRRRAPQ